MTTPEHNPFAPPKGELLPEPARPSDGAFWLDGRRLVARPGAKIDLPPWCVHCGADTPHGKRLNQIGIAAGSGKHQHVNIAYTLCRRCTWRQRIIVAIAIAPIAALCLYLHLTERVRIDLLLLALFILTAIIYRFMAHCDIERGFDQDGSITYVNFGEIYLQRLESWLHEHP